MYPSSLHRGLQGWRSQTWGLTLSPNPNKCNGSKLAAVGFHKLLRCANGRSRGLGNVRYSTEEEAQWAVEALRDRDLDGRQLLVQPDIRADHGEEMTKAKRARHFFV